MRAVALLGVLVKTTPWSKTNIGSLRKLRLLEEDVLLLGVDTQEVGEMSGTRPVLVF